MSMIAYLGGKISRESNYKELFFSGEERLKKSGYIVLNPAVLPSGMEQADYMRIFLAMLDCADVAWFLPNCKDSEGAKVEMAYCEKVGKQYSILD